MNDARSRILDAAEQAFADAGLAGARVAAIAKAADVNKAMLYYYFDSKDALFTAVIERVFDQMGEMVAEVEAEAGAPPDQALLHFLEGYRRVLHAHPAFVRLMMRLVLDQPEAIQEVLQPRLARFLPTIMAIIARGQAAGVINPAVNPVLVPPTLVAPIIFFNLMQPMLADLLGLSAEQTAALWATHSTELVLNGLRVRPESS